MCCWVWKLTAIGPDQASGLGVKGMQEDSHEGPDSRAKVDLVIVDDGTAASGPGAYEAIISEHPSFVGTPAELPGERAIGGVEAVEVAVIADDEDFVFPDGRRESDGAISIKAPELFSRLGIKRGELVSDHGGNKKTFPGEDRLVETIKLQLCLVSRPGGVRFRQLQCPLEIQLVGQLGG